MVEGGCGVISRGSVGSVRQTDDTQKQIDKGLGTAEGRCSVICPGRVGVVSWGEIKRHSLIVLVIPNTRNAQIQGIRADPAAQMAEGP